MYEAEAILITSFVSESLLQSDVLLAEAELNVNLIVETSEIPIIDEIDGGDFSDDSQFGPINGLLNGGAL